MKDLLISIFFILTFVISPYYVEATENELSTQGPGVFGYFSNLWKKPWNNKKVTLMQNSTRVHTTVSAANTLGLVGTSTTESAGLFNHVKNWVNVIREKIPFNVQNTTLRSLYPVTKKAISVASSSNFSINSTQIPYTSRIEKNTASALQPITNISLSVDLAETHSHEQMSSKEKVNANIPSSTIPASIAIVNASFTTPSTTTELLNKIPINLDLSLRGKISEIESNTSNANSTMEQNSKFQKEKIKKYVYLEEIINFKKNSLSLRLVSSSLNDSSESKTQSNRFSTGRVTKRKRSHVDKLTPLYFSFYGANDLNDDGLKGEAHSLPTVPSSFYFHRTKQRKMSKISKKRTKSKSTTDSCSSDLDLTHSVYDD